MKIQIPVFFHRINKIGLWDQDKGLTILVEDKMDLRQDLTGVHFDVTTTETSSPACCTETVNSLNLPLGYKVDTNVESVAS